MATGQVGDLRFSVDLPKGSKAFRDYLPGEYEGSFGTIGLGMHGPREDPVVLFEIALPVPTDRPPYIENGLPRAKLRCFATLDLRRKRVFEVPSLYEALELALEIFEKVPKEAFLDVPPTLGPTEKADARIVDLALQLMAAGKNHEARLALDKVISRTPPDYWCRAEYNDELVVKLWDDESRASFRRQYAATGGSRRLSFPANAYGRAHCLRARICIGERNFRDALHFLDRGFRLEPEQPDIMSLRGATLGALGRHQEALDCYAAVLRAKDWIPLSTWASATAGLGHELIQLGRRDDGLKALSACLAVDPENPLALAELRFLSGHSGGRH